MTETSVFRILQIEDNDGDVLALRRSFMRIGANVELTAVSRVEEGLKRLADTKASDFGLVLIDINMPGLSGFDLLKTLKAKTIRSSVPLFVLSSSHYEEDVALSHRLGADGFLTKPNDAAGFTKLAQFLHDIWNGRSDASYEGLRVPGNLVT